MSQRRQRRRGCLGACASSTTAWNVRGIKPECATKTTFKVWRQDSEGRWYPNTEWDKKSAAVWQASQLREGNPQFYITTKIVKCMKTLIGE